MWLQVPAFSLLINLPDIPLIKWFFWSTKHQVTVKNATTDSEPTSSNVFFCLTNSPKGKDIQFTIMFSRQKQQSLTFYSQ